MKKHELEAAIAAAEAKFAELRAMKQEPELHPMTLPLERASRGTEYTFLDSVRNALVILEAGFGSDAARWATANYYASEEQAERYADAFEVMRLMRRQPGIVAADAEGSKHRPCVTMRGDVFIESIGAPFRSSCMFPCFESQQAAEAAVAAVGADRLVRAANWLAGVVE